MNPLMSEPLLLTDKIYKLSGAKAFSFLQGQITQDVLNLDEAEMRPSFFLNTKGKIQSVLFVTKHKNECYLVLSDFSHEALIECIQRLGPLSGVTLQALDHLAVVHGTILESNPLSLKEIAWASFKVGRFGVLGEDYWIEKALLENIPLMEASQATAFWFLSKTPEWGKDYTPDHLPQETGLRQALHFKKGCYLGQEIVARLEYRGKVQKRLVYLEVPRYIIKEFKPLQTQEGVEQGTLTQFFFDEAAQKSLAFAYVKTEALSQNWPLFYDNQPVSIQVIGEIS